MNHYKITALEDIFADAILLDGSESHKEQILQGRTLEVLNVFQIWTIQVGHIYPIQGLEHLTDAIQLGSAARIEKAP